MLHWNEYEIESTEDRATANQKQIATLGDMKKVEFELRIVFLWECPIWNLNLKLTLCILL